MNFPFPTPPPDAALQAAERALVHIAALKPRNTTSSRRMASSADLQLTPLGHAMVVFPLPPRHTRIILEAAALVAEGRCRHDSNIHLSIALAASLSAESPFMHLNPPARNNPRMAGDASGADKLVRSLSCSQNMCRKALQIRPR
jgi:HrpA-like RNA helicase